MALFRDKTGEVKMNKCVLGGKFHNNIKNTKLTEATTPCLLFARDEYGMKIAMPICVACCIEISKVFSKRRDLILNKTIDPQDEKRNPDIAVQFLLKDLVKYADAVLKSCKSFVNAERECISCANKAWQDASRRGAPPIKEDTATEMNYTH